MKREATLKKVAGFLKNRLRIINACGSAKNAKLRRIEILCDQIIDSVIVGGITGISAYITAGEDASFKSAILAFLLTFLIKMKEYRKIR